MTGLRRARRSVCMVVALMLTGAGYCAQVAVSAARSPATQTECLGYYTVGLPGEFEYALLSNFSQGMGAWSSEIRLNLQGLESQELSITPPAGKAELGALVEALNAKQQEVRTDLLRQANLFTPDEAMHGKLKARAEATATFDSISGRAAYGAAINPGKLSLHALVNGHILTTELKPQGTPAQTLDAFLSHYKPRALGEVPTGPGVCVPFGVFAGEQQPATIGLNIRLKDQPDIVVFLLARDAASDTPEDPEKFIANAAQPGRTFYQARGRPIPMDRLKPLRNIVIDGAAGLGVFLRVKRDDDPYPSPINNPSDNGLDFAYLAYIPGLSGGKPGESFNVIFRVERFGRFATHPMSESEFRELTLRIAASIKRRPGAWLGH